MMRQIFNLGFVTGNRLLIEGPMGVNCEVQLYEIGTTEPVEVIKTDARCLTAVTTDTVNNKLLFGFMSTLTAMNPQV